MIRGVYSLSALPTYVNRVTINSNPDAELLQSPFLWMYLVFNYAGQGPGLGHYFFFFYTLPAHIG